MKDIVILGNGFVGNYLKRYFEREYKRARIVSNLVDRQLVDRFIEGRSDALADLRRSIRGKLEMHKPCAVINTIGYTGSPNVDGCESNRELTWLLNVEIPRILHSVICDRRNNPINHDFINISSGCIYTSDSSDITEHIYTENDFPNFGYSNPDSSWYSTTKHICEQNFIADSSWETHWRSATFRIRMPIVNNIAHPKNYITKIIKYGKLIDLRNSKTHLESLARVVDEYLAKVSILGYQGHIDNHDIFNVVNPDPLTTREIITILGEALVPDEKEWITYEELLKDVQCQRSNCILDSTKIENFLGYWLETEQEMIQQIHDANIYGGN